MNPHGNDILDSLMLSLAAGAAEEATTTPSHAAIHANADSNREGSRSAAMELALETLLRVCIEKGMFTQEEFIERARAIDLEDGVMDGRRDLGRMRRICPNCHKPNAADRPACMWCGAKIVDVSPEPVPAL